MSFFTYCRYWYTIMCH